MMRILSLFNTYHNNPTLWKVVAYLLMLACAAMSWNNVRSVVYEIEGSDLSAKLAGVVLGGILVVASAILSNTKADWSNWTFRLIFGVSITFAILSGSVQAIGYYEKGGVVGSAIGFMIPICGEFLLGLLVSWFDTVLKNRAIDEGQESLEATVNEVVSMAMRQVTPEQVERQITSATRKMTADIIDTSMHNMYVKLQNRRLEVPGSRIENGHAEAAQLPSESGISHEMRPDEDFKKEETQGSGFSNPEAANRKRSEIKQQNLEALLRHLAANETSTTGNLVTLLGVSKDTIRRYCTEDLADHVESVKRGTWRLIGDQAKPGVDSSKRIDYFSASSPT